LKPFYKAFYKQAEALRKEVSTVAVMKDGKMLMGKRRDNDKWTAPGGHLDKGEDPLDGAVRELREESGIVADKKDLKFIRTITNKENGYVVHGYEYHPKGDVSTSMKNDPDGEVYRWHFKDPSMIEDKDLHVPRSKGNVLLGEVKEAKLNLAGPLLRKLKKGKISIPDLKKYKVDLGKLNDSNVIEFASKKVESRQKQEKKAFWEGFGI
jgi:8-oxo-dGTP pyrophosphatase MutT (NUDIX family)